MKVNTNKLNNVHIDDIESLELVSGEFVNEEPVEARAYYLSNGDVFGLFNGLKLEFEDGLLYEVEFDGYEFIYDGIGINEQWIRTGVIYTQDQINGMFMEGN